MNFRILAEQCKIFSPPFAELSRKHRNKWKTDRLAFMRGPSLCADKQMGASVSTGKLLKNMHTCARTWLYSPSKRGIEYP